VSSRCDIEEVSSKPLGSIAPGKISSNRLDAPAPVAVSSSIASEDSNICEKPEYSFHLASQTVGIKNTVFPSSLRSEFVRSSSMSYLYAFASSFRFSGDTISVLSISSLVSTSLSRIAFTIPISNLSLWKLKSYSAIPITFRALSI